jgi:acetyl esterase
MSEPVPEALLQFMESFDLTEGMPLSQFLAQYDSTFNPPGVPSEPQHLVPVASVDGWDVRAAIWRPDGDGPFPVVLHFHGGGWVSGNHLSHRALAATLAAAGFLTVAIDYRRAPKHRFPAAFDDCRGALGWCRDHIGAFGGDPERIAVLGDSAGANLAAAVIAHDDDGSVTAGALLFGIYDYHQALPVVGRLTGGTTRQDQAYVAPEDFDSLRRDPRLSPVFAERDWPHMYVAVGDRDPLLEESRSLHRAWLAAGVDHEYHELVDAPHSYIQLEGHPSYDIGMKSLISFIRREL